MTDRSDRYAYTLPQKLIAIALAPIVLTFVNYAIMKLLDPAPGQGMLLGVWVGATVVGVPLAWLGMTAGIFLWLKGRMEWLPALAGVALVTGTFMGVVLALMSHFAQREMLLASILYALAMSVTVWLLYLGLCAGWRTVARCRMSCAANRAS